MTAIRSKKTPLRVAASFALAMPIATGLLTSAKAETSAAVTGVTVEGASPSAITTQARAFVQSVATAPNPEVGQISRWHEAVCAQVEGLAQPSQAAVIKERIEGVAQDLGVPAARPGCTANVEVVFSDDAQATMNEVAKRHEDLLGYYHRRDHDRLKVVSRPIQAWYKTATRGESANDEKDSGSPWAVRVDEPGEPTPTTCGDAPHFTACLTSEFVNVFIVVDSKALRGKSLGSVAEYVVMLALSQPKSLDGCAALPSILDLTAKSACPTRQAPTALTPADGAWLTALYASDAEAKGDGERSEITARMADILVKANTAAKQVAR